MSISAITGKPWLSAYPDILISVEHNSEEVEHLSNDYEAITRFVQEQIIDVELPLNTLEITKPAVTSILRGFGSLGWKPLFDVSSTQKSPRYVIHSPNQQEVLQMVGGKVFRHPKRTETICTRKHLTKRMLELGQLPVAIGGDFLPEEKEIAVAYFEMMTKPAVVKPADSGGSAGVTVGVVDNLEFEKAWDNALAGGRKNSRVLIEKFVRGIELRAYVIGNQVVSIIARVQPFVVGTGSATVAQLIRDDNIARKINYRAHKLPVVVDWDFVKKWGHGENTVPRAGEILFLNRLSIPQVGALIVDVTASVSPSIKEIAVRAKSMIPDLEIAGIDILVNDLADSGSAYILEINTSAALDLHRYPTHGLAREVDKDIVDYFHQWYTGSSGFRV